MAMTYLIDFKKVVLLKESLITSLVIEDLNDNRDPKNYANYEFYYMCGEIFIGQVYQVDDWPKSESIFDLVIHCLNSYQPSRQEVEEGQSLSHLHNCDISTPEQ